jgi:hypothetical protein
MSKTLRPFAKPEELILALVTEYGRITRLEAADLCRLGSYQVSRLLQLPAAGH